MSVSLRLKYEPCPSSNLFNTLVTSERTRALEAVVEGWFQRGMAENIQDIFWLKKKFVLLTIQFDLLYATLLDSDKLFTVFILSCLVC